MYIFSKHLSNFDEKLDNFEMGIIKQFKPCMLDIAEDFYIYNTKSDIYGINRHKIIKYTLFLILAWCSIDILNNSWSIS